MKIRDRPATKPRPAVATGSDADADADAAAPDPTATAGCPARAPRYARYAGTSGSTHGDTNETRPARKAMAGVMPSRVGTPALSRLQHGRLSGKLLDRVQDLRPDPQWQVVAHAL